MILGLAIAAGLRQRVTNTYPYFEPNPDANTHSHANAVANKRVADSDF